MSFTFERTAPSQLSEETPPRRPAQIVPGLPGDYLPLGEEGKLVLADVALRPKEPTPTN